MFDWFSVSDRIFVLFAYIAPLTALVLFGVLFIEYKNEMRKRNIKNKRR